MSVSSKFGACLLGFCLLTGSAFAEGPREKLDHLSYYTYYKTGASESVSEIAAKFGLAEVSLVKMNPQLKYSTEGTLPAGTLLCIPKEKPPLMEPEVEKIVAKSDAVSRDSDDSESKPLKRSKKRKKKEISEEPDEEEWEKLAELATKGAPKQSYLVETTPIAPASKLVRPNGEVVWIPAAAPKPAPKPKVDRRTRDRGDRVELSSRKGKAINGVLTTCRSYMGTPYVWGGELPGGFDCSGYVQYVFAKHGYKLPRTADIQFEVGDPVKRGKEKPGDLVFFETYAPGASHVGVYLGRGYFIHASSSRGVTVERLATDFFAQRYLGAKRTSF